MNFQVQVQCTNAFDVITGGTVQGKKGLEFEWQAIKMSGLVRVVSMCTKKVIAGQAQGATSDALHQAAILQKKPWYFLTLSRLYSTTVSHSNQMMKSTVRKAQNKVQR